LRRRNDEYTQAKKKFYPMQGERMERKVASDYPQELLDLFHEYQHGDIDRRTFLDRAGKFAVGGPVKLSLREMWPARTRSNRWCAVERTNSALRSVRDEHRSRNPSGV
jgi:hypothetical protein